MIVRESHWPGVCKESFARESVRNGRLVRPELECGIQYPNGGALGKFIVDPYRVGIAEHRGALCSGPLRPIVVVCSRLKLREQASHVINLQGNSQVLSREESSFRHRMCSA